MLRILERRISLLDSLLASHPIFKRVCQWACDYDAISAVQYLCLAVDKAALTASQNKGNASSIISETPMLISFPNSLNLMRVLLRRKNLLKTPQVLIN